MSIELQQLQIEQDVALARYTSWRVGGTADFFSAPTTIEDLMRVLQWRASRELPLTVLSGGTNVLISDRGVRGLVLSTHGLSRLEVTKQDQQLTIVAEAGVAKTKLVKTFLDYKLPPAVFLAGLPGDLGGGIAMNAGVSEAIVPREFCEVVDWVDTVDEAGLKCTRKQNQELKWSYRSCSGWQPGVIVRAGLSWVLEDENTNVGVQVRKGTRDRLNKQPLDLPSCGSVFRNPLPHKAGHLIDECGLKGTRIGGACVSEKHANFIVNDQKGSAQDIYQLIQLVQKTVQDKKSVTLHTEVVLMGEFA